MKNLFFLLLTSAGFFACTNESTESTATEPTIAVQEINACYTSINKKDSLQLSLNIIGTRVRGEMKYQLYKKGPNQGTLRGKLMGDTIVADYTFLSEGKQSVRQLAFLRKGDTLTEGFGELINNKGIMTFSNTAALDFSKGILLQKTDCP
jgi:hypothetical protein